ncbi:MULTISPECIES: PP2C family protein-serine/threonine phosphatase [unclassified Streptomyces]|uniref:PP2C family protein-serine/threonine phosphatase n=1 Tax=unclassified Streptomyces TaxID=2593676 RepID=UPI00225A0E37|nr:MULTISPECIES: PP2C family protein-serine/threonine phosphatase [unclassified Streptomyces]MCX4529130.1 serine/threonine-protein phosphatase [Streptomyces sp. NBC_01551]MCX4540187.1 serine/threonine-protein phosphatase [Streptomyces sp. NBC_01565]
MDHRPPPPPFSRPPEPRLALLSVPFALIAIVTVVDVLAPPDVHLGPFLVAAPAVTASFAGPWMTAFVGAVAVLAQSVVAIWRTTLTDLNHTFQIIALILISAFVTFFAHLREVHEEQLTQLRSVAEAAQQVVLRPLPARMGPLRVAAVYLAAEAEAQIGGDLYAAARTPDSTRLIIGDVRGKGLEAVGEAAIVLGAFRAAAHQEDDLPGLVAYLEAAVAADPDGGEGREGLEGDGEDLAPPGEGFTTAAVIDIPDRGASLQLVSCGHPPPLLLRGGRVIPLEVDHPAPPLGLTQFVETGFGAQSFAFEPGDMVLLYTDGVIEARDKAGTFYPLPERAADWPDDGPDALLRHLCADLLGHATGGRLGDDAAMVAIERVGGGR